MSKPALVPLFLLACACAPDIGGSHVAARPIPVGAFQTGLGPARAQSSKSGSVLLSQPATRRVLIPGGAFLMGSSVPDLGVIASLCLHEPLAVLCDPEKTRRMFLAEAPAHEVTLSPFAIDRTEVTVAAYGRCVATGACTPSVRAADDARFDRADLPVTFVAWDAAAAYCRWAGGRLPTEAEWELAARGPDNRTFPWGNVYNPYLCNHGSLALDPMDGRDGFELLAPVGSFPDGATPLGVEDLAGNVSEWVSDLYETDDSGFGYPQTSQVNPTGPHFGSLHVTRGGAYTDGAVFMRGASRSPGLEPSPTVGFRCAADVQ